MPTADNGSRDAALGLPEAFSSMTVMILLAAMACALVLHLATPMHSYFGEPDAAKLVNDALLWMRGGLRTNELSEYRYYSSPGYIWLVTRLLPGPSGDIGSVATTLNRINVVVAVVVIVPFFLLCRRIAGERAAAIAAVVVSFTPTFFQAGLYGFPTLLAEFALLWAIWGFDRWLTRNRPGKSDLWLLGIVCCCLTATLLLKVDVYLGAVALWGLLVLRGQFTRTNVIALAVTGAIPVVVMGLVVKALLAHSPSTVGYVHDWDTTFPISLRGQLNAAHVLQLMKSMGVVTLPLFAVAVGWLFRQGRWPLAAMLSVWAALPIAFWFFRFGDSARHHFPSSPPIVLGVAVLLAAIPVSAFVRAVVVALLIGVNYFAFPPSADTWITSGRLIGSGRMLANFVGAYHRPARAYANLDLPRQVFVGGWPRVYYVHTEVLARADTILGYRLSTRYGLPAVDIEYLHAGKRYAWTSMVATRRTTPDQVRAAADAYVGDGYKVFTMEFDSTLGLRVAPPAYQLRAYLAAPTAMAGVGATP